MTSANSFGSSSSRRALGEEVKEERGRERKREEGGWERENKQLRIERTEYVGMSLPWWSG